jgi:glycosyltransferase involved in cell wall biosynthesis
MKILFTVLYYEPAWAYGGPPRMTFDLACELVRRGHEVTVVTTDALDRGQRIRTREEVSHGVRIVRFPNWSNRLAFELKIFLPRGDRRWLDREVRNFDVVHLFDARSTLNAHAARAAVRANVPFALSVWGSLPRGEGWKSWIKRVHDVREYPTVLGRASALLAQNDHEAQVYADYGGDPARTKLWPLAVDPGVYSKLPAPGAFRAKHGIGADERVVLFVGRITELKGLDPLLRAFAEAQRAVPRARLVVVGRDDGYLERMHALARELGITERLLFAGPLYGDEVLPAYVDSDLFCIAPTHFEETSLAALQACACGRPVLINDRCEIPWLDEFDAGRTVPGFETLGREMTALLSDTTGLERMGRNARRMVEERFFLPRIVDQLESIYGLVAGVDGSGKTSKIARS